jgi:hypothetical protein
MLLQNESPSTSLPRYAPPEVLEGHRRELRLQQRVHHAPAAQGRLRRSELKEEFIESRRPDKLFQHALGSQILGTVAQLLHRRSKQTKGLLERTARSNR